MIAFLAAAAAFSSPSPIDANTWFQGFGAHPKEGPLTVIASEITVNRNGYAESCRASVVAGDPNWAPFTCQLIKGRGRFRPAKLDGHSAYGVYRLRTAWVQSGSPPANIPVWDLEVGLSDVPVGLKLPSLKKIQFTVDRTGRVQACNARGAWDHPELASLACAQMPEKLAIKPAADRSGKVVESVQDATVRFVPTGTR